MKLRITYFKILLLIAVILLDGCSGCAQKTALKGVEPQDDYNNQSQYGPVAANSREPTQLPPFPEPSFERLIEQFKADVTENKGNPEVLKRKKEAIANPDLLWEPYFKVPVSDILDPDIQPDNYFDDKIAFRNHDQKGQPFRSSVLLRSDYKSIEVDFTGTVFYTTKDQEERMDALKQNRLNTDVNFYYYIKYYEILFEGINNFTAAKYLRGGRSDNISPIGAEYAERAMIDHPDSAEVMFIWTECLPDNAKHRIPAYQRVLNKFPNAAFAHEKLAFYYYHEGDEDLAFRHIQKACQLDSRIAKKNPLLAMCYYKRSECEKSVAAFQGLPWIRTSIHGWSEIEEAFISAQQQIYKQHHGLYYGEPIEELEFITPPNSLEEQK